MQQLVQELKPTTEARIVDSVVAALKGRIYEEDQKAQNLRPGETYDRKYNIADLELPAYKKWIADLIALHKSRGLLYTEQQLKDFLQKRPLAEDDRARFIGEDRLEPTSTGRLYPRKRGEEGRITTALKGNDGLRIYTFMPDVPPESMKEGGPDVFVATLQVKEGTAGYLDLERIP
jgi:hypothetical protein